MISRRLGADSSIPASAVNSAHSGSTRFSNHGPSSSDCATAPGRTEQGHQPMSKHVTISPSEAADRLAIRELIEVYAHCADRRDAKGPDVSLHRGHPLRGVYERQRSDALAGAAFARGARAGVRRFEQI